MFVLALDSAPICPFAGYDQANGGLLELIFQGRIVIVLPTGLDLGRRLVPPKFHFHFRVGRNRFRRVLPLWLSTQRPDAESYAFVSHVDRH